MSGTGVPSHKFVAHQQGEKRSGARRAGAGLAVANASAANTADERFSLCFRPCSCFHSAPDQDFAIRGMDIEAYGFSSDLMASEGNGTAKRDIALGLRARGDRLEGFIEYDVDLFRRASVETMARQFLALLEGAVHDPDRPISRLPMMSDDRHRRVAGRNTPGASS